MDDFKIIIGLTFLLWSALLNSGTSQAQTKAPELSIVQIDAVNPPIFRMVNGKFYKGTIYSCAHGIVIDPSGIIATNYHVIKGFKRIYVHLVSGETYRAYVIHSTKPDLTFLKIYSPHSISAITWSNSNNAKPGNPIFVLPINIPSQTPPLAGKINHLIEDFPTKTELLELKLKTKPGDSGSPVLDEHGHLLGMIMGARISDRTISYAIASNQILKEFLMLKIP